MAVRLDHPVASAYSETSLVLTKDGYEDDENSRDSSHFDQVGNGCELEADYIKVGKVMVVHC